MAIALTHQNFTSSTVAEADGVSYLLEATESDEKRFEKVYNFAGNHDINCVRVASRRSVVGPIPQVNVEVLRSNGATTFKLIAQQSVVADEGFVLKNSDGRTHITADFYAIFPSGLSDIWVVFAQNIACLLLFFVVYLLIERWDKHIKELRKLNPLERTKLPEGVWNYFEQSVS